MHRGEALKNIQENIGILSMTTDSPTFVDIAFNLDDAMYRGIYNGKTKHPGDLKQVVADAVGGRVTKILATGTSLKGATNTLELIKSLDPERKWLWCTVGVHPTESTEFERHLSSGALLDELKNLIFNNQSIVRAYGEYGLDLERTNYCDFETQLKHFEPQLRLASYIKLPSFFHNRNASDVFYPLIERYPDVLKAGGVVHSFDGTLEDANKALAYGLDLGLNGCSIRDKSSYEAIRQTPPERIHVETDSPWCSIKPTHDSFQYVQWEIDTDSRSVKPQSYNPDCRPRSMVKGRNEPMLLPQVAECVYRINVSDRYEPSYDDYRNWCRTVHDRSVRLFNLE